MLERIKLKKLIIEMMARKFPIEKPRGSIMEVLFDPSKTKFDINDYIIRSLKSRRTQRYVLSKAKDVLQYHMVGKCVRFRKRGLGTTFKLRNALSLTVFELNYSIYSRYITHVVIYNKVSKKYKKSAQYYLRKRPPIKSNVKFEFTIEEMKIWAEETTGEVENSEDVEERSGDYSQQIIYRKFSTGIIQSAQEKVKRHL
jgi:ribosomal protein L19